MKPYCLLLCYVQFSNIFYHFKSLHFILKHFPNIYFYHLVQQTQFKSQSIMDEFMEFEYVLSMYGVGSTQWLINHPKVKAFLKIHTTIWLIFPVFQILLILISDDWSFDQIFSNQSYQLYHIINFILFMLSLISFVYTMKRIDDLRRILFELRKVKRTSNKSKHYLTITIVFFSAQIAILCIVISLTENRLRIQQIFEFNPSYNGFLIRYSYFISLFNVTSRFSLLINVLFYYCCKIISIYIIYILFYYKFNQTVCSLFPEQTCQLSCLLPKPDDIVKVDKSVYDLLMIKSKLNPYLKFISYCIVLDITVSMMSSLMFFKAIIQPENNLIILFSLIIWCVIFTLKISFTLIPILNKAKMSFKNVDIIVGIRKMERLISIQKDRKLHDRFIYMQYQDLEKIFHDFKN
jgi:uncharacterized membrane protein